MAIGVEKKEGSPVLVFSNNESLEAFARLTPHEQRSVLRVLHDFASETPNQADADNRKRLKEHISMSFNSLQEISNKRDEQFFPNGKQIQEFILSQGPPTYKFSIGMVSQRFFGRRLKSLDKGDRAMYLRLWEHIKKTQKRIKNGHKTMEWIKSKEDGETFFMLTEQKEKIQMRKPLLVRE